MTERDFLRLFFEQIANLLRMAYPKEIIDFLSSKEKELFELVSKIEFPEGRIAFIPVIPEKTLSYRDQAQLVSGISYLKSTLDVRGWRHTLLDDLNNTYIPTYSREPYYIIDVVLVHEKSLSGYQKVNHQEVFALASHNPGLLKSKKKVATTACDWEGMETAVLKYSSLESGYSDLFITADWENLTTDVEIAFCKSRLV